MKNVFLYFFALVFVSCAPLRNRSAHTIAFDKPASINDEPDYSSLTYWAAHPLKHDPSDSVPSFLIKNHVADTTVDVFFIHPTTYTDASMPYGWNAPILQQSINTKTDASTILYQASIFNVSSRVYAPRYRQANLQAYYTKDAAAALQAFMLAYADVKKAFAYYLSHENHGRPIIIAAHSQGTTHAKWLIRDFFDGKDLQKQLVAAYLVGMAVEPTWFKNIKPCTTADETGCFCSWRTYQKDYLPGFVQKETFNAVVTNPLTWRTDEPVATRAENRGGVLLKFNKRVPHVADAIVTKKVLWIHKPHFFGAALLHKNYHVGDYNLFYVNVQQNVEQRIQAWKKSHNNSIQR